jgi:hypothetical protein
VCNCGTPASESALSTRQCGQRSCARAGAE